MRSFATQTSTECPACHRTFDATIWLVVDAAERPDLLARVRDDTLHRLTCPHCGQPAGEADAPLLIYRPDAEPRLIFSPAQQTSTEQDREHAAMLVAHLRDVLGEGWRDEWVEGMLMVPRLLLPAALSDDPEAALRRMAEETQQALEHLREEDPEAYQQLEKAARAMQAAERAARLLAQLEEAEDKERFLRQHLDEFDDEVLAALGALAQAAAELGEEEAAQGIAAVAAAIEALRLEQNPTAREMVEAMVGDGDLAMHLQAFITAETWAESRRIVEAHPELLTDEADALLGQLIEAACTQGDENGVRLLEEHRTLLRRCREVGVEE